MDRTGNFNRATRFRQFGTGLVFGATTTAFATVVVLALFVDTQGVLGRNHCVAANLPWHLRIGTVTIPEYLMLVWWDSVMRFVLGFLTLSVLCRLMVSRKRPMAKPVTPGASVHLAFAPPPEPRLATLASAFYLIGLLWIGVYAARNGVGRCNVAATMTGGANPSWLVPCETWFVYDGLSGLVLAIGAIALARLHDRLRPLDRNPEPLIASVEIVVLAVTAICFLALVCFLIDRTW